jgi:carotenoid cleavage dioxygenase-like enzyme
MSSSEVLFDGQGDDYRSRWHDIQAEFVDHPRQAVEEADGLVSEVMQDLARVFADERRRLEAQWDTGDDADTEDLRVALTRYRSFFERLLAV